MATRLEFLYAATALLAVLALAAWLRSRRGGEAPRRRALAGRLLLSAAGLALVCGALYWYLSPSV